MEPRTSPLVPRCRACSWAACLLILAWTLSDPTAYAAALAQWVPASPFGGRVSLAPAVGSPVVYAGAAPGGFYRSGDGGSSWELRNGSAETIAPLAVDPDDTDHVFAGSGALLLESRDGGISWRQRLTAFPSTPVQVVFAPAAPQTVWAAMPTGLFRSSDGGEHWAVAAFSGSPVSALAFDAHSPLVLLAAVGGAAAGIWRSLDGGTTWSATPPFNNSTAIQGLVADPVRRGTFYAFASYNTAGEGAAILFATPDRGTHWAARARTLQYLSDVAALPSGRLLAALYFGPLGVLHSDDGGFSWAPALTAPPSASRPRDLIAQLAVLGSGSVLAAGADGVWRSTDGEAWRASSQGILVANPFEVTVSVTGEVFASLDYGLFRSDDHGQSWQQAAPGGSSGSGFDVVADPVQAGVLYAPFPTLRSTDRGRTWRHILSGLWCDPGLFCNNEVGGFVIDRRDPNTIYLSGLSGIHNDDSWFLLRSRDGGDTWSFVAPNLDFVTALVIDPKHSNILFGVVDSATLVKSVDFGDSWMPVIPGLPSFSIPPGWTLTIDPFNNHVLYAGSQDQGVAVSDDDGVHFRPMNEGFPDAHASVLYLVADPLRPGHLYAGLREGGVYRWTSAGLWEAINNGLPFATTQEYGPRFWGAIALDPVADILYAATAQGIFRLDPPDQ